LKDAISKVQGTQGLKDMAKNGAFRDLIGTTLVEGTGDIGKLTADLENLANTSASLADFTAGVDKLVGTLGGTGKSSAETVAGLLKLNDTFKAVTKTSEEAAAATAKEADAKAKAAEDAKRKEEDARKIAVDAAYGNLQAAVEREREGLQQRLEGVRQIQDSLTTVVEAAGSAVRELRGNVQVTAAVQTRQAMVTIDGTLAALRSGTSLPADSAALAEAISVVRGSLTESSFASVQDYERAQLALANKLAGIEDQGGKQLTDVQRTAEGIERQIAQNDKALDYWRRQIDGTTKNIDATLSVVGAITKLESLLFPGGKPGTGTGSGKDQGGAVFGPGGTPDTAPKDPPKYVQPRPDGSGNTWYEGITDQGRIRELDKYHDGYHAFDGTGDAEGLNKWIKDNNLSPKDLADLSGLYERDWVNWFNSNRIPAYADGGQHWGGIRLVGERGPELEMTGPARYWSADQTRSMLGGQASGVDISRLDALFSQLLQENRLFRELLVRIAGDGQRSREALEGAARGQFEFAVRMQ